MRSKIVSKLGEGTFTQNQPKITAGSIDYLKRTQKEQEAKDQYIRGLNIPPGPPTQHGIYATPEWTGQPYPSIDWEAISQNQEPPEGWPRYPRFNDKGDVPGPPVQYGEPLTNATATAGFNFIPNNKEENNIYYYHPDHLGSSSYITDKDGQVIQHTEYMAFGEVLVDEHSTTNKMPYLFNGKELDYETGLYYYGARYYDPKVSIFLNVDPLVEKTGTPYAYTYNNPINLIDPTGMEAEDVDDWIKNDKTGKIEWRNDVTKKSETPQGYTYIGKEDSDIVKHLFGKNIFLTSTTDIGAIGVEDYENPYSSRGAAVTNAQFITNMQVSFSADVDTKYNSDKIFKGVNINVSIYGTNSAPSTANIGLGGEATLQGNNIPITKSNPNGNITIGGDFPTLNYSTYWNAPSIQKNHGKTYDLNFSFKGNYNNNGVPLGHVGIGFFIPNSTKLDTKIKFHNPKKTGIKW